ncbi:Uncharacterized protein HSBGL_0306 [Halapricum desulfuricans]|uniref:Rhomboid family intramembrane serine protease n=1 Tax=Halapricum desulfuricans TaxID=2841257 RepID=A0A897NIE5_9EURY|nr:hypothetical protein [Halapricum desulfuricans]QSG10743.1 Uncharacterized protein HSBGL_0306 [Halapricum desulfuricans]
MDDDSRSRSADPLGRTIRERAAPADLLLLSIAPAVLLAVYALPTATREALVFEYAAPTVRTAVASPFVHFRWSHLLFNLGGYLLVAGTAYVLSVAADRRREFVIVFASLLLASPPLLSALNLTIVRRGVAYGFSGVVMAYYGTLAIAIAVHAQQRLDVSDARSVAPLLFFLGLLVVTTQTLRAVLGRPVTVAVEGVPTSVTWVLVATLAELLVLLALVVTLYALSIADGDPIGRQLRAAVERSGDAELAVSALLLFLAVPFATFPPDPVSGTRVFNLYVHAVGYALGFIAAYLYHVLGRSGDRS